MSQRGFLFPPFPVFAPLRVFDALALCMNRTRNRILACLLFLSALALCSCYLTGCAWDAAHRATTIAALKESARKLGRDVLAEVGAAAQQYILTGNVDAVHLLADALWKNGGAADLTEAIAIATGSDQLAAVAVRLVNQAASTGITQQDAAHAVAAALSATALSAAK